MDTTCPSTGNDGAGRFFPPGALALACAVLLVGCTSPRPSGPAARSETPSAASRPVDESTLNRVANSAASGSNVSVRLIEGVAYVTGEVTTAIEENAIVRALRNVEGVARVESHVARNM